MRHVATHFGKDFYQVVHCIEVDRLVQRDTYPTCLIVVEINACLFCHFAQAVCPIFYGSVRNLERIEELDVLLLEAIGLEQLVEIHGLTVYAFGYLA